MKSLLFSDPCSPTLMVIMEFLHWLFFVWFLEFLTIVQLSISLSLAIMYLQGISPTSAQSWTFPWANVFSNIWTFSFICHMDNWHLTGQNLGLLYSLPTLILTFCYLQTQGTSSHWKFFISVSSSQYPLWWLSLDSRYELFQYPSFFLSNHPLLQFQSNIIITITVKKCKPMYVYLQLLMSVMP